jgi:DNA-binding winged helix-turn-helix (wHTH) protein
MRTHTTGCSEYGPMEVAFIDTEQRTSKARSHSLNEPIRREQHRTLASINQIPPRLRTQAAELLVDIDGVPVLMRFLVKDVPAEGQSDFLRGNTDLHHLLSATLEKVAARIGGWAYRSANRKRQAIATLELISSADQLARPQSSNDTVLRVGALELDLLDRTAWRGDRRIDLRPREFQLLKYMMQRSDKLLTRTILLKDVWNYKFVPETNLVDVHMGRLRRKVDGPNEPPLIRSVRGVGFVLSSAPLFKVLDK